jgi:rhamnogalacturonan endolyase
VASRDLILLLRITALAAMLSAAVLRANVPGGGNTGDDVICHDEDAAVVLDNGIIRATIQKTNAHLSSILFHHVEMLTDEPKKEHFYYELNASGGLEMADSCTFSVTTRTPDFVDLCFKKTWSPDAGENPVDIEIHYALGRGNTGIYSYSVLEHKPDYPDFSLGLWHVIMRLAHDDRNFLFENIYINDQKHGPTPTFEDYTKAEQTGIKEIWKITTGAKAGTYDCKYDNTALYSEMNCWGFASDVNHVGAWFVVGSHEFFNEGPADYELNAAEGTNLIILNGVHYQAGGLTALKGAEWRKIYGPFLVYFSSRETGDANWADAKAQGDAETAAWPYTWLNDPGYPQKDGRGAVTGRFVIHDPLRPSAGSAHAWVGLAQPEEKEGNWQMQARDYQYWVKADAGGNFSIPNIRPGSYTLYAFADGTVGEFSKKDVTVTAAHPLSLGELTWNVAHHGSSIAWEIGYPDRSAEEFRHGHDYPKGYIWQKFSSEFPNPLEYTIGASKPDTDWNYAQCAYVMPDGKLVPWKWHINFNLATVPAQGDATLTLAFAGAEGHLYVYVNDDDKLFSAFYADPQGGNALFREGIRARYAVKYLAIPVSLLKPGKNTITLMMASVQTMQSNIMYDYLNLEMP